MTLTNYQIYNTAPKKIPTRISPEQRALLAALSKTHGDADIAERFGVTQSQVEYARVKAGIFKKKRLTYVNT